METNAENIIAMQNETEDTVDSRKESVVNIDFKMVAFSLAGKDYAIDILKVKEILLHLYWEFTIYVVILFRL